MSEESDNDEDDIAPEPRKNPDLIGHQGAEAEFMAAYNSGRMPHAWLISGPKGTGKAAPDNSSILCVVTPATRRPAGSTS